MDNCGCNHDQWQQGTKEEERSDDVFLEGGIVLSAHVLNPPPSSSSSSFLHCYSSSCMLSSSAHWLPGGCFRHPIGCRARQSHQPRLIYRMYEPERTVFCFRAATADCRALYPVPQGTKRRGNSHPESVFIFFYFLYIYTL